MTMGNKIMGYGRTHIIRPVYVSPPVERLGLRFARVIPLETLYDIFFENIVEIIFTKININDTIYFLTKERLKEQKIFLFKREWKQRIIQDMIIMMLRPMVLAAPG
jgi:hypothetical protein